MGRWRSGYWRSCPPAALSRLLHFNPSFVIVSVTSDGSCQFSAVAVQLPTQPTPLEVRTAVCDFIANPPNMFRVAGLTIDQALQASSMPTVQNYVQRMRHPRESGGDLTLHIMAQVYNLQITVIMCVSEANVLVVEPAQRLATEPQKIVLLCILGSDFNSSGHYLACIEPGTPRPHWRVDEWWPQQQQQPVLNPMLTGGGQGADDNDSDYGDDDDDHDGQRLGQTFRPPEWEQYVWQFAVPALNCNRRPSRFV